MNEQNQSSTATRRHPGRVYLFLAVLFALVGPALYFGQLSAKVLTTPWYVPLLATAGVASAALALLRARSIWRWAAIILVTLLAAAEWAFLLVAMGTPAYTGPAKSGQAFPAFATSLADGSAFSQSDLKGDQGTVMVFFRGHW
ncbi:MAG TPA: hypothetical protein VKE94_00615 [Gemmataceae bacterium]|nr:hypothetical protein [Gemmataceae bacterium]